MEAFIEKYRRGDYTGDIPKRPDDFAEGPGKYLAPPPPVNELRRNKTLYYYRLDEEVRQALQKVVSLANRLFDVDSILVNFIDRKQQIVFQSHSFPLGNMDRNISFCGHGILTPRQNFIVPDTHLDWRFEQNPLVTQENGIRFYAGAPIIASLSSKPSSEHELKTEENGDEALGMVCLLDSQPRQTLSETEEMILQNISDVIGDVLNGHLSMLQLKERNAMSQSLIRYIDSMTAINEARSNPFQLAEIILKETLKMDVVTIFEAEGLGNITGKHHARDMYDALPRANIIYEGSDMKEMIINVNLKGEKREFRVQRGQHIWESDNLEESALIVPFVVHETTYLIVCSTLDREHVLDTYDANYVIQFGQAITVHVQQSLVVQANDAKSYFIQSVSHELRTPLHGIMTSAELLREDIDTSQRGLVDMIELSGKNLANVINGLLDLSRWEAKTVQINKESFDPLDLQQNIADTFAFSQTADLSIVLEADAELAEANTIADQSIVRQIILNLMSNAVKFTRQGVVTLSFKVRHGNVNGRQSYVDCFVSDTGVGMSGNFVENGLFRPFKKEDGFTQGLGLSLAVSQHLADLTHSSVQLLCTEHDKGTDMLYSFPIQIDKKENPAMKSQCSLVIDTDTYSNSVSVNASRKLLTTVLKITEQNGGDRQTANLVRLLDYDQDLPDDNELVNCHVKTILLCQPDVLPIISDEVAALPHVVIRTKPIGVPKLRSALNELVVKHLEHTKKTEVQQPRVLIVDDNAVNRNMLAMYCRKRKVYFETACDGQEACNKFRDGRFSIVLMDCQMPTMDGLTASKIIRQCERERKGSGGNCLIIILTGLSIHELKDTSQEVGANHVCGKPISLKTLDSLLGI